MDTPPLERRLLAILAADVEGYSRLMHADEEGTLATLSGHRAIVDGLIEGWRGHIRGTAGDGILAEFPSVVDAVTCAVAIQRALGPANAGLPTGRRMHLRIAINVGDVVVKDGDIFGDGVNVAARLEAFAEPGGLVVSRAVRDQVRDRVEFSFHDVGEHRVKNIARPVHVFRVGFDPDVAVELPSGPLAERDEAPAERQPPGSEAIELAFWTSVEAGGRSDDYLAYLERFPGGSFAPLALSRLSAPRRPLADREPAESQAVELAFWDTVKGSEDPAMFQAYLDKYPEGDFSSLAKLRIAALAGRPLVRGPARHPSGLIRAA